jgi:membrane protein required for colicin V production
MVDITWQNLNWFDCAILIILGLSIVVSILRGFIREILSIIIWLVAVMLALKFALPASTAMHDIVGSPLVRYIIAFIAILFVILILGMILNSLIRRLMKKSSIGILDRLLGFFFGFGRGVLLVSLVLLLLRVSSLQDSPMIKNSELAPQFNDVVTWLHDFLPKEIQQISKWSKTSTADLLNSAPLKDVNQTYTSTITHAATEAAGKVGF